MLNPVTLILTKSMLMEICDLPREGDDGKMLSPNDFSREELEEMLRDALEKRRQPDQELPTPIQLHKMVDLLLY